MDSIAASIYHSCEPAIVPEIEPYTVDDKNLRNCHKINHTFGRMI